MDISLEEIYEQHPRLRPEDSDSDELRNLKSHYVWIYSMSPEEREEYDRMEAKAEREREVESLIHLYHLNQDIRQHALQFAKDMGRKLRLAFEDEDRAEAEKLIGYIRTAKETMTIIDEEQIRIRNDIKDVRRNGTWHEKLQAKRKMKQQKKN